MTYLYTCLHCDQQFEVTEKHAGMYFPCPLCEATNQIPGMREIRKLPPKEEIAAGSGAAIFGRRNEARSWLFSGGLLVAVTTGLLGIALWGYANSLVVESTVDQQVEWGRTQLSELAGGQLWDAWDSMSQGLPDWSESHAVRYNKQSGYLKNIAYGLFAASALGLLALAGSFLYARRDGSR